MCCLIKRNDVIKMIGIGAAIALGGVVLKGVVKLSTDKGFSFGVKKAVNHLHEKNRGKDTKLSRFLNKLVGVSNEELATLIDQRTDEIIEAMMVGTQQLDETSEGLLEMTRQIQDMMGNYQQLGSEDQEFIQSLKDAINPDTLASEIVESMKKYQGEGIKIEDITGEIGFLFSEMGWGDKFDQVQSSLDMMEEDIREILSRTGTMSSDLKDIKKRLEDAPPSSNTDITIQDSVLQRSAVGTATGGGIGAVQGDAVGSGDVYKDVQGGVVKNIVTGQVGGDVNIMNFNAEQLSKDDWKDVLSSAITKMKIPLDIDDEGDQDSFDKEFDYEKTTHIQAKIEEVERHYGSHIGDCGVYVRLGNIAYKKGDLRNAMAYYSRALKIDKTCKKALKNSLTTDKMMRNRMIRELSKNNAHLSDIMEEAYEEGEFQVVKDLQKVLDEIEMFRKDIESSVEGIYDIDQGRGGIDVAKYDRVIAYDIEIIDQITEIVKHGKGFEDFDIDEISEYPKVFKKGVRNIKKAIVTARNAYKDRMSIIEGGM